MEWKMSEAYLSPVTVGCMYSVCVFSPLAPCVFLPSLSLSLSDFGISASTPHIDVRQPRPSSEPLHMSRRQGTNTTTVMRPPLELLYHTNTMNTRR
jgi:hypothetical protein